MKVIITGIAGLLGSRFAQWLRINQPLVEILGIDDFSGGFVENIPTEILINRRSLGNDPPSYCQADFIRFKPDYVFHFAAFAAEGLSPFVRRYTINNTWAATADIINACIETQSVQRLVFTSSMAIYGKQQPPFDEAMTPAPIDPYGVGKTACERDIQIAGEQHGLSWTIIRPHNIFGDQQNIWGDYRNVLGIWMRQVLEGQPIRIYGLGQQRRAFSYIDDCLSCFWTAAISAQTRSKIINLGGTVPISIIEAASLLANIVGGAKIIHTEPRHEVSQAWSTWELSQELLDYEDRTSFEEGVISMWKWASSAWEKYPERRNPSLLNYEIKSGLYSWWDKKHVLDKAKLKL